MSGGEWNYRNDDLCFQIFDEYPDYGLDSEIQKSAKARKKNPLQDRLVSEMIFDVFCVLHSYDWYVSGDISEESYKQDLKFFRDKWLRTISRERVKKLIDEAVSETKSDLYQSLLGTEVQDV